MVADQFAGHLQAGRPGSICAQLSASRSRQPVALGVGALGEPAQVHLDPLRAAHQRGQRRRRPARGPGSPVAAACSRWATSRCVRGPRGPAASRSRLAGMPAARPCGRLRQAPGRHRRADLRRARRWRHPPPAASAPGGPAGPGPGPPAARTPGRSRPGRGRTGGSSGLRRCSSSSPSETRAWSSNAARCASSCTSSRGSAVAGRLGERRPARRARPSGDRSWMTPSYSCRPAHSRTSATSRSQTARSRGRQVISHGARPLSWPGG